MGNSNKTKNIKEKKKNNSTSSKKHLLSKKRGRGFTLVELLAVIVILGILTSISFVAITAVIDKAKVQYYHSQEDNMVAAAHSYAEKNSQYLPKVSGQTLKVSLSDLVQTKYISELVNYQKQKCDEEKSYVQIFRYQNDYYYTPYLECAPYYSDTISQFSNFKNDPIVFNGKLINAGAKISFSDITYGIVSYSYSVYADGKLVYESDHYDAGRSKTTISRDINLTSFVPAKIKLVVSMTNGQGVDSTFSGSKDYSGGTGSGDVTSTYIDCGTRTNSTKSWSKFDKTVSVKCNSKDASLGCARESFSKRYTTDIQSDQITIYDKNGNYKKCDVDVYLDKTYPTLKVNVYKAGSDGKKTGSAIASTTAQNGDPVKSLNITYDAVNGWLNNSKYQYGLVIEASYSDSSPIRTLFVAENNRLIFDESNPNYSTMIGNTTDPNKKSDSLSFAMLDEGIRIWKMMVTDSVGFTSSVTLTFKMDKSLPTCNFTQQKTGGWTKDDVTIKLYCSDPNSSGCTQTNYDKTYNGNDTVEKGSVEISDKAGNKRTCEYSVKHDKQAPSCGDNDGSTDWKKGSRKVTVQCTNDHGGSGCEKSSFSNTWSNTSIYGGSVIIKDKVGNAATCGVNVYLDNTKPTIHGGYCTGYRGSQVVIGLKFTDAHSGVDNDESKLEYCYTVKHGTPSCSSGASWYHKTYYNSGTNDWYADGGHMETKVENGQTIFFGSISAGCAEHSDQNVHASWHLCDNVGNCTNSGHMNYNYWNGRHC